MVKPMFVLGVGAQKSATSWLYEQLRCQPFADFGFTKEYRIWNNLFLPQFNLHRVEHYMSSVPGWDYADMLRQMETEDGKYEQYFKSLLSDSVNMTGDITPSYAMLDASHFSIIKSKLENAGFDVKVIFLMRDPVERVLSSIRMTPTSKVLKGSDFLEYILERYKSSGAVGRTRYDKTVLGLRQVFDESQLHFDFYERLFEPAAIDRLNNFLGVELQNVNLHRKINASDPFSFPEYLTVKCREYYSEVYDFCRQTFPETQTLWQHM